MMWLNTETRFHEEPNTIRAWLIQVPAKLISRARQLILTLIYDYVFKERWLEIEDSISTLNFAWAISTGLTLFPRGIRDNCVRFLDW